MHFVGRQRETRQILKQLEGGARGRHLVITGKFGIGRTRLLRHVAEVAGVQWRFVFVDFQQTAARAAIQVLAELGQVAGKAHPKKRPAYRATRYRIAHLKLDLDLPPVVVLDDLRKITRPRLRLLEHLDTAVGCPLIVVLDDSVSREGVLQVRVALRSAPVLHLERLSARFCVQFFRRLSLDAGLAWTEERIQALARAAGGYPLAMMDAALRAAGKTELIKTKRLTP